MKKNENALTAASRLHHAGKRAVLAVCALLMLCGTAACGTQNAPQPAQTGAPAAESDTQEASAADSDTPEATAAEAPKAEFDPETLPKIELSSENLHDGVWDADISNTDKGSNRSPQLTWEPVQDAACYAVYMVDTTATFWLHWKSGNVTETELPAGWAPGTEYVGPYPPSGTHDYEIRVYALKEPVTEEKSKFDSSNYGFDDMVRALDGDGGNVLAYGTLTGSYTRS